MYDAGIQDRNQFVIDGHLDVRRILEKFVETFHHLYGDADETFLEDAGRRYFMLFLRGSFGRQGLDRGSCLIANCLLLPRVLYALDKRIFIITC